MARLCRGSGHHERGTADLIAQRENLREKLAYALSCAGMSSGKNPLIDNQPHIADKQNRGKITGAARRLGEYCDNALY